MNTYESLVDTLLQEIWLVFPANNLQTHATEKGSKKSPSVPDCQNRLHLRDSKKTVIAPVLKIFMGQEFLSITTLHWFQEHSC